MSTDTGTERPSKRRSGDAMGGLPVADPRPILDGDAVLGMRCTTCRYPTAQSGIPWCPSCYSPAEPARFAATGSVWSSTVVAIPVGQRRPPFALAYLDLDDGPRLLVHLSEPRVASIGTRLRVTTTEHGDLVAAPEGGAS